MGYLLDKVDQTALANQQDVVRNERRQSVENQPYGLAEEAWCRRSSRQVTPTTATSSVHTKTFRR